MYPPRIYSQGYSLAKAKHNDHKLQISFMSSLNPQFICPQTQGEQPLYFKSEILENFQMPAI